MFSNLFIFLLDSGLSAPNLFFIKSLFFIINPPSSILLTSYQHHCSINTAVTGEENGMECCIRSSVVFTMALNAILYSWMNYCNFTVFSLVKNWGMMTKYPISQILWGSNKTWYSQGALETQTIQLKIIITRNGKPIQLWYLWKYSIVCFSLALN